jgi:hypothetical protein
MSNCKILVTATVVTEDGQAAFATYQGNTETLEEVIEQATGGAYERYEEVEGDLPELHRVVVHVDTVPELKRRPTVVTSILPEQPEHDAIQSQAIA